MTKEQMLEKEIKLLKQQIQLVINYCKNGKYGTDFIIKTLQSKKIQEIEEKIKNMD